MDRISWRHSLMSEIVSSCSRCMYLPSQMPPRSTTTALTTVATAVSTVCSGLAGLAVDGVLAAPPAVLLELEAVAVVHLVLLGDVVPPLAVVAGERDRRSVVGFRHRRSPTFRSASRVRRRR